MTTEEWINFITGEVESSLTLLYGYAAFSDTLKEKKHVELINKNARFCEFLNRSQAQILSGKC